MQQLDEGSNCMENKRLRDLDNNVLRVALRFYTISQTYDGKYQLTDEQ
jgi:hypothetical protein